MRFSIGGGRAVTVHLDQSDKMNANVGGCLNKNHCSLEFYERGGDCLAVFATQDQLVALARLILENAGLPIRCKGCGVVLQMPEEATP